MLRPCFSAVHGLAPLPLCVISCISCGHVSLAVLTQSAQSWGLNPCHCPSPKPEGSSQARGFCVTLSADSQQHSEETLSDLRTWQSSERVPHKHLCSIYYNTVTLYVCICSSFWGAPIHIHTLKSWTHTCNRVCLDEGQVKSQPRVQCRAPEYTSGRLGLFVIHRQKGQ